MSVEVGDIAAYAMATQVAKITHSADIAVMKAQNEATEALVDMVSEVVDSSKAISASATHGKNIDISV
ncbi:MAG: hypothetical protein LBL47_01220 [Lactobacillus sp.]|jgi:hypothetical protein|nr:hypothetical protein [Lactobacillus sp.]